MTLNTIDQISLTTTRVFLRKGTVDVSQGTGFLFVNKNVLFLITNFHVLTGFSPEKYKNQPLGDNILFSLHESDTDPRIIKQINYPLYTKDNNPIWIINKKYPKADVAAIPLVTSVYQGCKVKAINEKLINSDFRLHPGIETCVIGYPHGLFDSKNNLPIWKSGTIASEPYFDFNDEPKMLIDISAFPGMSGSPVFAVANGVYESEKSSEVSLGNIRRFIGIYSSTYSLDESKFLEIIDNQKKRGIIHSESLQIGEIWKANLLLELTNELDPDEYKSKLLG